MHNNDMLFYSLKDKVPNDALLPLKESLDKADESIGQRLLLVNFKNALLGLVFAVVLPGIDRIYKGDTLLGIFKIIYFLGVYIALNMSERLDVTDDETLIALIVLFVLIIGLLVWFIADIFLVWRGIKRDNLKKIFEVLEVKNG